MKEREESAFTLSQPLLARWTLADNEMSLLGLEWERGVSTRESLRISVLLGCFLWHFVWSIPGFVSMRFPHLPDCGFPHFPPRHSLLCPTGVLCICKTLTIPSKSKHP